MPDINLINRFLQKELSRRGLRTITAVEAGGWLDQAGLLADSEIRPGRPLKNLLRENKIVGQVWEQKKAPGKWVIYAVHSSALPHKSKKAKRVQPVLQVQPWLLPDVLEKNLKLVFAGLAPDAASAERGHYYAAPGDAFWTLLYESRIVPKRLDADHDQRLIDHQVGLTDVFKAHALSAAPGLDPQQHKSGIQSFIWRMSVFSPRLVCFNGWEAFKSLAGKRALAYGLTDERIGDSSVFVVPATAAHTSPTERFDGKTRAEWFRYLAELIE